MSLELNFLREHFPSEWDDDIHMNFLFSPFRERYLNPEGHDGKLNFWINTIKDLCVKSQSPVISKSSLSAALERKNRQPLCLDRVLNEMSRQGIIIRMSDYSVQEESGWFIWLFDMFIKIPVSSVISSVHRLLNFDKTEEKFVLICVVKVIRFRKLDENIIQSLSELDKEILSLRKVAYNLRAVIKDLEKRIQHYEEETKDLLLRGSKTKARESLMMKKRFEASLKSKNIAYNNIENLVYRLKNTGNEKMILDAYRSGVKAMKYATTGELSLDNINAVISDVQEILSSNPSYEKAMTMANEDDEDERDALTLNLEESSSSDPSSGDASTLVAGDDNVNIHKSEELLVDLQEDETRRCSPEC